MEETKKTDYELFLLAIPIIAVIMEWGWIANLDINDSPRIKLDIIVMLAAVSTGIIAAMESSKSKQIRNDVAKDCSPIVWFLMVIVVWCVGYPFYLYKRKHYGLRNRLWFGIANVLVFSISFLIIDSSMGPRY